MHMKEILYGVAYYDEYMPYDRLEDDIRMMKKAGINVVRIAESTWSTCEPREGEFDFSHVIRVLDICEREHIYVIIGTPTYAVPTWLVKKYPEVLATTKQGKGVYGARQIMDITNPDYLFYGERVIRELMKVSAHRTCVIGFQLDNETKYYGTAGENVQQKFVAYLRDKFDDDLDRMNYEFGLDYWSNRINNWEDFPDIRGTINGSLGAEFEKFQRTLVDDFLRWQADIVSEYKRENQFITHNFDFDWRGYSYGVQPDVNHSLASKAVTIAGCDIYHPNQDHLTGAEIAFGGDMTRCLKNDNYLVLETEAQGFPCWTPFKGQLRLCAYSHLASGANSVMYWHWHSIHNSYETYWKGLLSHDFQENETYKEACIVGNELKKIGQKLINLKKRNDVAIMVSNEALTALNWFGIQATAGDNGKVFYNDVLRWIYDTLFFMNVECDFVWPQTEGLSKYKMIVVPALYAVPDETLERLKGYVADGGTLLATFKSAFANEHIKVSTKEQPRIIGEALGVAYNQFTFPQNVGLRGKLFTNRDSGGTAEVFMELLEARSADVLASYEHPNWERYAAITKSTYGKGHGYYIGCMTDEKTLGLVLRDALSTADIESSHVKAPVIVRTGINEMGKKVQYFLNYSPKSQKVINDVGEGLNLLTGKEIAEKENINLGPWDVAILEYE